MDKTVVSVIVITYNSSQYIGETLDSILNQTYQDIELIISDDCSTDNTISICENWIQKYSTRFRDIKIIAATRNAGIPANCNKGLAACNGDWIKLIAGDDILMEDCIASNLAFVRLQGNEDKLFVVSDMRSFLDWDYQAEEHVSAYNINIFGENIDVKEQYQESLKGFFGNSPTFFVHKKVYEITTYDESYPFMEDYPFVLNALKNGIKIHYLKQETVHYRIRNNSAYNGDSQLIFPNFYLRQRIFDKKERLPNLSFNERMLENTIYYKKMFFDKFKLNSRKKVNIFLYKYSDVLNPFYIYYRLKHIFE
ncbi:glycosyltransferase family 2 protein [Sphingobacterium kitahiroshimense]|uniref:Glycosyltransferase n=1 Tax=Sphingobacterium kitahiroshimense TaxID=470446 RepID=A0ABV0C0V0_9SPHI